MRLRPRIAYPTFANTKRITIMTEPYLSEGISHNATTGSQAVRRTRRHTLRFRLSIRVMIAVISIVCVILSIVYGPLERQRRAAKHINASGGTVVYEHMLEQGVWNEHTPPAPDWLIWLFGMDYFDDPVCVYLSGGQSTPDCVARLKDLRPLCKVSISNLDITSADMASLSCLQELREMHFVFMRIDRPLFRAIVENRHLERLSFEQSRLSEDGLACLRELPELRELRLLSSGLSDEGLANLRECHRLESLSINGWKVSDGGIKSICELPSLSRLSVDCAMITDHSVAHLHNLSTLRELSLDGTRVTDASIDELVKLSRLRVLSVSNTKISPDGYVRLKEGLPACQIRL